MNDSLSVLKFGSVELSIYGTVAEPLIKCSDLLIKVLGYRDCSNANFFKNMRKNEIFVKPCESQGSGFFTEFGVYHALMKSNKPIAE